MLQIKALLKFGAYALPALVLGVILWSYQQNRIDACRIELSTSNAAAQSSNNVVTRLVEDAARNRMTCADIIKSKNKAITDMQAVDRLEGGRNAKTSDSGDPILDRLNGLFP